MDGTRSNNALQTLRVEDQDHVIEIRLEAHDPSTNPPPACRIATSPRSL